MTCGPGTPETDPRGGERQHGAAPDEHRDRRHLGRDGDGGPGAGRGRVELEPRGATRQQHGAVRRALLEDRRRHQPPAHRPLVLHAREPVLAREIEEQRPNHGVPRGARGVGEAVHKGHEPVPEQERRPHAGLRRRAVEPGPMRSVLDPAVDPHHRHQRRELVPPGQQLGRGGPSLEPALKIQIQVQETGHEIAVYSGATTRTAAQCCMGTNINVGAASSHRAALTTSCRCSIDSACVAYTSVRTLLRW